MTLFINASLLDTLYRKKAHRGDTARRNLDSSLLPWPLGNSGVISETTGRKTRLNHLDSFARKIRSRSLQTPSAFSLFLNLTWFCLSEHSSPTLQWAFSPLKDAGSNIGVRVSLGDDRGLQFSDNIQLHHPDAELQEYGECVGGGKAKVSACLHDRWINRCVNGMIQCLKKRHGNILMFKI